MNALMRKPHKSLLTLAVGAALAGASFASSAAVVGFDVNGGGAYSTFFDIATDSTDSALSTGIATGATLNPPGTVGELRSQTTIAELRHNGVVVSPLGLNFNGLGGFELTKVVRLNETVLSDTISPIDGSKTITFGNASQIGTDVDPLHVGPGGVVDQQLAIYFDRLGDGTTAVPGNGAGTVRCYGAPTTGGTGCPGTGTGPADGDGVLIASAHIIFNNSSFTSQGPAYNVGTGSFELRFVFDYVNAAYLDIPVGSSFVERFTGTINQPSTYFPDQIWDGTPTAGGVLFKVDSSETFVTPEPSSLALAGLALAGLGATVRRRNRSR